MVYLLQKTLYRAWSFSGKIFFINIIIIFFLSARGSSLNRNWFALLFRSFLAWHFVRFYARHGNPYARLTSMPSMTSLSLSLFFFFTMPGMNIHCKPSLSLFQKMMHVSDMMVKLMTMKQCLCCIYFNWRTCALCFHAHAISNAL